MKVFRLVALAVVVASAFSLPQNAAAQAERVSDVEQAKRIEKYVFPILKDPRFVALDWQAGILLKADHGYLALPPEKPQHANGVYRMQGLAIELFKVDPLEVSCLIGPGSDEYRVVTNPQNAVTQEQAKTIAEGFLRDHFAWVFKLQPRFYEKKSPTKNDSNYFFSWRQDDVEGFEDLIASACVRALDGKITSFDVSHWMSPRPKHKILPAQARKAAAEFLKVESKIGNQEIQDKKLGDGFTLYISHGKSYYGFFASGNLVALYDGKIVKTPVLASISVDAMTGQTSKHLGWEIPEGAYQAEREAQRRASHLPFDSMPVWTSAGLVFRSERALAAMPQWAPTLTQAMIVEPNGEIKYLTCDLKTPVTSLAGLPGSSWITLQRGEYGFQWSYCHDLASGQQHRLSHPERKVNEVVVDALGQSAAMIGTSRDEQDVNLDLFVDDLNSQSAVKLPVRLRAEGQQHHPLFSLDGKWLYFVTTKYQRPKPPAYHEIRPDTLQRIPAQLTKATKSFSLDAGQVETILALPDEVQRLSFFSDGTQMLMQGSKGLYRLSLSTKKAVSFEWNKLQDVELNNASIERIQDGCAGPGNDRVTFAGYTRAKDGMERQRIYSCKFDGSDLKAHTPKIYNPTEPHAFATTGKTALDVNQSWASAEIEWLQALRR